jgi:hypothetical protein
MIWYTKTTDTSLIGPVGKNTNWQYQLAKLSEVASNSCIELVVMPAVDKAKPPA